MTRVGWCGLGQMGAPMAARLLDAGFELAVWNRTAARADPLVERGARRASTPADAAAGAEVVATMLATPEALDEVLFGPEGVAAGIGRGCTLVEMSTVGRAVVEKVAGRLPDGVDMLDAPVLGSVGQAEDGVLKVFVGGPAGLFERRRPLLSHLGRPLHVGPLGAGASMKLVANSILGALMTALAEALALADALGLDQAQVLDVLAESPIGTTVRSKRDKVESSAYPPNFKLALAAKDLRLVTEAGSGAGLDLRLAAAARSWLEEAAGDPALAGLDYSAVIAHVRGLPASPG